MILSSVCTPTEAKLRWGAVAPRGPTRDRLAGPKRLARIRSSGQLTTTNRLAQAAGHSASVVARAAQVAAHVSEEIGADVPLHKAPLPVAALEAVVIPTAHDGLQSEIR